MRDYKMWIGGQWVGAESGKTFTCVNPATEEEVGRVPLGGKADVDKAVSAARDAFQIWSKKTQAERCTMVNRIAIALRERARELEEIDTIEHGTPLRLAPFYTMMSADMYETAAQVSRAAVGDVVPVRPGILTYTQREPVGVCALIIPWNAPLMMVSMKLGACLAMGNTAILKPPSIDSLTVLKLGEVLEKLELPPGTVNIITGPGGGVGDALAIHPGVDKISFTGSCETGKSIMACASDTVKRISLELGGKSPFIVLDDADVDGAVNGAIMAAYSNTGMICASPGRYYIHEGIYDEFIEKFVGAASKLIVGDPRDPNTQLGPVVSSEHRDKVEYYIKKGVEEGATLLLGGKRPTDPPLDKGYFVMPAIFTDVKQHMAIARDEIFGPVACIFKFSSSDDVLSLANDNTFGLTASVWTKDTAKGIEYANELKAGFVWINEHLAIPMELPWGGFRESGFGKELFTHGLNEFTQLKAIYVDLAKGSPKPWHTL
jgi:acyl-CoA reductase-like NAD-dependent aldehyde dehydrogenase